MASISRWLYRLFSMCLPCLKSAETDEKESEEGDGEAHAAAVDQSSTSLDHELSHTVKNVSSATVPLTDEEEAEGNDESEIKGDEYPEWLNPFSNEDEEDDYPQELNPFDGEDDDEADSAVSNQSSKSLDHELSPTVKNGSSATVPLTDEEETEGNDESELKGGEYPEWLNPFSSEDEEDDYPQELNPFDSEDDDEADSTLFNQSATVPLTDESEEKGNEYPECLNHFANDDKEGDYPDGLNPFNGEDDVDEAYSALVNQAATTLSSELTAVISNGSSTKFPLPAEEKSGFELGESGHQGEEYPDILNPFATEDEAEEYPEALNPFAHEDENPSPQSSPETPFPASSIYKVDEYDETLNPFASEYMENKDSIKGRPSMSVGPQQTTAAVNGSTSLVPLPNKIKKAKSTKKYRAPEPPVTLWVTPTESAASAKELAPGVNESASCAKELAPGVNESASCANELAPGVNESAASAKELAPGVNESASCAKELAPGVNESVPEDTETSGHVPLTVTVDDYDEALNPFDSEDEEATGDTTGNSSSSSAQRSASGCTPLHEKTKKAKSLKKRRAPDPPVPESAKEGSASGNSALRQFFKSWHQKQRKPVKKKPVLPPTSN